MSVIPSEGTTFGFADVQGGPFTVVAEVTAVTPVGGEVPSVPTTKLTATAKTFRPGKIPDFGEVELTINYDPNDSTHQSLVALLATPETKWFQITYNDGSATTSADEVFEGFITSFSPESQEDETNVVRTITIKVTGAPVRTAGV